MAEINASSTGGFRRFLKLFNWSRSADAHIFNGGQQGTGLYFACRANRASEKPAFVKMTMLEDLLHRHIPKPPTEKLTSQASAGMREVPARCVLKPTTSWADLVRAQSFRSGLLGGRVGSTYFTTVPVYDENKAQAIEVNAIGIAKSLILDEKGLSIELYSKDGQYRTLNFPPEHEVSKYAAEMSDLLREFQIDPENIDTRNGALPVVDTITDKILNDPVVSEPMRSSDPHEHLPVSKDDSINRELAQAQEATTSFSEEDPDYSAGAYEDSEAQPSSQGRRQANRLPPPQKAPGPHNPTQKPQPDTKGNQSSKVPAPKAPQPHVTDQPKQDIPSPTNEKQSVTSEPLESEPPPNTEPARMDGAVAASKNFTVTQMGAVRSITFKHPQEILILQLPPLVRIAGNSYRLQDAVYNTLAALQEQNQNCPMVATQLVRENGGLVHIPIVNIAGRNISVDKTTDRSVEAIGVPGSQPAAPGTEERIIQAALETVVVAPDDIDSRTMKTWSDEELDRLSNGDAGTSDIGAEGPPPTSQPEQAAPSLEGTEATALPENEVNGVEQHGATNDKTKKDNAVKPASDPIVPDGQEMPAQSGKEKKPNLIDMGDGRQLVVFDHAAFKPTAPPGVATP